MKTHSNFFRKRNLPALLVWLPVFFLVSVSYISCLGYAASQADALPLISVDVHNVPLRTAAATIGEKIGGYRVALQSIDPDMKVSGRFKESTIDTVFTQLLKGYNLAILVDPRGRVVTVQSLGKKTTPQGSDHLSGTDDGSMDSPEQDSPAQESASSPMIDPDSLNGMVHSEKNDPVTGQSYEEIAAMHARDKKEREQTQLDPAIVDPMTGIPHAELKKLLEQ